ncbi:hypothetical protein BGZ94_008934 [Podila epigama]|nr:hypothetical protein BGZ94_008934 [Podila epigama]
MKFIAILAATIATASAIVTRDLPFVKTLSKPKNHIDYEQPHKYYGVSRCEFSNSTLPNIHVLQRIAGPRWECVSFGEGRYNHCSVKPHITDLTSLEFARVTTALCTRYNGFLMINMDPSHMLGEC